VKNAHARLNPSNQKECFLTNTDQPLQFDLISTWGDQCGIFEYVHALLRAGDFFQGLNQVFARQQVGSPPESGAPIDIGLKVSRCWRDEEQWGETLQSDLQQSKAPALWMQYHPSFYDAESFNEIAQILQRTQYRKRVVTVHNPRYLANSQLITAFTDIVVHNQQALHELGDVEGANVHVIPHFIYSREEFEPAPKTESFTIAAAGFAAQNKRVPLLIDAFAIAHALNPSLRCKILTSPLPTHAAHFEISRIIASIKNSSARAAIEMDLTVKAMPELLRALSGADLLCMPYEDTGESASGAARLGLAAGVPILRSQSSIFHDIPGGDFVLYNEKPQTIAEAIIMLSQMPSLVLEKQREIDSIYAEQSARSIANQYHQLLK